MVFVSLWVYAEALAQVGVVDADTVFVDQELDHVEVVGKRGGGEYQAIDASKALEVAGASGGIEGVVKSQMGVASNSELSSQYRVRGGNFDENMVYVNNIEVYKPFLIRSGEQEGLSFVNPDMVDRVNFSSGGFDVSFADKMSSVLDVKYKVPHAWHGSARVSLLGASAHIEGASNRKEDAAVDYSHITGFRYKTNKYLLGSMDTKGEYDPTFFDVQSFHTWVIGNKVKVDVLGYYASNRYKLEPKDRETKFGTLTDPKTFVIYFEGNEDDRYKTGMVAGSVTYYPNADHSLSLTSSMYRSEEQENYDVLGEYWLQQASNDDEKIGVGGYLEHARNELFGAVSTYSLRGSDRFGAHSLRWEAKLQAERFSDYMNEWECRDSSGYLASPNDGIIDFDRCVLADNELKSRRLMAYVMDNVRFELGNGYLGLNYGVRLSRWNANGQTIVSPRVSLKYYKDSWEYRLCMGVYDQMPFFRELRGVDGRLNKTVKAQDSWQVVCGADHYFTASGRPFKFTVEAYCKLMRNLNPYSIDNVRIRYMADNCAKGYAAGVDFKINGELVEGVESWASLSLMKTAEDVEGDGHGWIARPSDQRVNFTLFFQDYMPSNKSVGANLNFIMGSGLPFGPPNSPRYMQKSRMPGYKRVDLGLFKDFGKTRDGEKRWKMVNSSRLGLEVFNLFDFSNTISYFWISEVGGGKYAVPNYLTARRINVKLSIEF